MNTNVWKDLIEENRDAIKAELKESLEKSLCYSQMQYTVYIDSDGDVWSHEELTGSNWSPVSLNSKAIKVFNGDHWSWTDGFSPDECLKMVLDEATAEEKNAFEEWKSDHEYDDETDTSTLFEWWKDTAAAEKCKYESILAVADAYDYDLDVDQAIERLNW